MTAVPFVEPERRNKCIVNKDKLKEFGRGLYELCVKHKAWIQESTIEFAGDEKLYDFTVFGQ